jgi:hypothetical protein
MVFRYFWIFILGSLALLAVQASAADAADDDKRYATVKLLDPDVPQAEREATLAHYKQKALDGNVYSQYIIGSLYRIGDRLPGNIVPLDLDQARKYLSTAAAHGHIRAMAKMAELELSQKKYLEAMIWAQLFGYYSGLNGADEKTIHDNTASAYLADLVLRISGRLDPAQMPAVSNDMAAFIAAHDADIQKGKSAPASSSSSTEKMQVRSSQRKHMIVPPPSNGPRKDVLADYLIAFDANGEASQAWLVDALPDVALGKALKFIAMNVEVNPAADGADVRYALQPINFSWGRSKLQAAHP